MTESIQIMNTNVKGCGFQAPNIMGRNFNCILHVNCSLLAHYIIIITMMTRSLNIKERTNLSKWEQSQNKNEMSVGWWQALKF